MAKFLSILLGVCLIGIQSSFGQIFEWQRLEFDYPSDAARDADILAGNYIEGRGAPIDMDVQYFGTTDDRRVFITVPRFVQGIALTFGIVSKTKTINNNPVIAPFPSWEWQQNLRQCNAKRLVSVFRVKIDECNRLWVLDTGRIENEIICRPQLLAFDLNNPDDDNNLIYQFELPISQYEPRSIFVTPIVDVLSTSNNCQNTFVYLADCQAYSIVVVDVVKNRSWRIIDKTFYPYPSFGTFRIEGDRFELMDGVLGMDLTPFVAGRTDRRLIYHALSSNTENWVYAHYLRNESLWANGNNSPDLFVTYKGTRPSQSAAIAIDKNGIAFYGNMADNSIRCWNTAYQYGYYTDIVARNRVILQFPSGIKIIKNREGVQEIWVLTSAIQKVFTGHLSPTSSNFRILAGYVSNLLEYSDCVV